MPIRYRSLGLALSAGIFSVACGGAATPQPTTAKGTTQPVPTAAKEEPPPIPIPVPQVDPAPSLCDAYVKDVPAPKPKDPACADQKSVLAALASAALAEKKGDHAARDAALNSLAACEKVPTLVPETLRAELSPIVCAEAILAPALDAHGKEAFPPHLAAARALVGASRLARLRPKKGAFDVLARWNEDKKAAEAGAQTALVWHEAIVKQEAEAIALAKAAPSEIVALTQFEDSAAWLALAKEVRSTPLPEGETKKNPDLAATYYGKLDELTMPWVEQARAAAANGLGKARVDGIEVKPLPHFQQLADAFKSRPLFETRATRELELLAPDPLAGKEPTDAVKVAAILPPWAVYALLERVSPSSLLDPQVLMALAAQRGIPAALRYEAEPKPKAKLDAKAQKETDARMSAIALARLRMALTYGSRADAAAVAAWTAKDPTDQLRVAVAKALLGPTKAGEAPKPGTAEATQPVVGFDLAPLDALAKKGGPIGQAAQYNAALLALDAAQTFGGVPTNPMETKTDPKKSYEDAIARLDAFANVKGADATRVANAKKLADSARETVKLLNKK